jgi:hypothetical protein
MAKALHVGSGPWVAALAYWHDVINVSSQLWATLEHAIGVLQEHHSPQPTPLARQVDRPALVPSLVALDFTLRRMLSTTAAIAASRGAAGVGTQPRDSLRHKRTTPLLQPHPVLQETSVQPRHDHRQ